MDFRFTEDQQKLQQEIAEFARKELPDGWVGPYDFEGEYDETCWPVTKEMAKKLFMMQLAKTGKSTTERRTASDEDMEFVRQKAADALYRLWRSGIEFCKKTEQDMEKSLNGILLARFLSGAGGE